MPLSRAQDSFDIVSQDIDLGRTVRSITVVNEGRHRPFLRPSISTSNSDAPADVFLPPHAPGGNFIRIAPFSLPHSKFLLPLPPRPSSL